MRTLSLLLLFASLCLAQLEGIVDIHVHGDPDSVPRKFDFLDLARGAEQAGLRAVVLKSHYAPTVQSAYFVSREVKGVAVFGAIALNRSVGGVNAAAVAQAAAVKGHLLRVVWMPTFDAENQARFAGDGRPFVPVSRNGALLPEVIEVLKVIAKEKLALATGHSSPAESLLMIREARKMGIDRIVVTHPLYAPVGMSIAQMREAAQMGAYLEFCANQVLPTTPAANRVPFGDFIKGIRTAGIDRAILSSDLGQPENPMHADGWKQYIRMLQGAGITTEEIDAMARRNPARLIKFGTEP